MAMELTMDPLSRPSLPTTTLVGAFCSFIHTARAAVQSTTSAGVRLSPAFPPMVPLIPDIDFINVTYLCFQAVKLAHFIICWSKILTELLSGHKFLFILLLASDCNSLSLYPQTPKKWK